MKNITYEKERLFLSPYAQKSIDTKGRYAFEPECPMRTEFQRDRDRIIHSKSFRRLKNKTQVFLSPEGDHYRTRLTHTLDVSQIARSICRALCLNEDLAEAISLGHDLGHTPFGHAGERALASKTNGYFDHAKQSLRVVRYLENDGKGLNLTYEVEDGIENHQMHSTRKTLEADAVCIADKIAYINHDIDDALRAKIITLDEFPYELISILGSRSSQRINTMITSIYDMSNGKNFVKMEKHIEDATMKLRDFMYTNIYCVNTYFKNEAKVEEDKAILMIETIYDYINKNIDILPEQYKNLLETFSKEQVLCDFISNMTDRYAIHFFENTFVPKSWSLL